MTLNERRAGAVLVVVGLLLISLSLLLLRAPAAPRPAGAEILRLHVLAHSDSAADQAVKRRVRDVLQAALVDDQRAAPGAAALAARLRPRLGELARLAQAELRVAGYSYPVAVELGRFAFDARRLGGATVPPGEYPALRVRLGDGAGQNFWCLLFPPLCFGAVTAPAGEGEVLLAGPATGQPLEVADELAPEARSALLDWLAAHGVRVERLGRRLRLWLEGAADRNPSLPAA